jgi:AraC family transcriptional regulator
MGATCPTASLREDRIDGPTAWIIEPDDHLLIVHQAGVYIGLETVLDGALTSAGEPVPGEAWLIPAGHRYTGRAKGGQVSYIAASIPGDRLAWTARSPALAGAASPLLAATARALVSEEAGTGDALCAILADWAERGASRPVTPAIRGRIGQLVALINRHIEGPLPIAALADEYGSSVNTLITHFAGVTGQTPGQYVLAQRLRRACWLLTDPSLAITEVALAAGFASHAHLCTSFRERFGQSPGAWRRHYAAMR